MASVLSAKHISAGYGEKCIVSDLSIEVSPRETVSLIGRNGVGKTTILRSLAGMLPLLSGEILFEGKTLETLGLAERARKISVCFTERMDAGQMSCFEVVGMGRYPYTGRFGKLQKEDERVIRETMEMTGIADFWNLPYRKASDGMKQLVLLARAMAQEPDLLILDEPTSYLDISHKLELLDVIKRMAAEKDVSILTSFHELELAWAFSDKIYCLSDRKLAKCGTPEEVIKDPFICEMYGLKPGRLKELYEGFAETL